MEEALHQKRTLADRIQVDKEIYLDAPELSDIPGLVKYLNDDTIYRMTLKIPRPYTAKDGEWYINFSQERKKKFGHLMEWSIRNENSELIGGIGLQGALSRPSHREVLGFWLGRPYWNRKIMSRVLNVFCDYTFDHFRIVRLEAHVYIDNPASCRLLEKAGFVKEAIMKKYIFKDGEYIDCFLYARVR